MAELRLYVEDMKFPEREEVLGQVAWISLASYASDKYRAPKMTPDCMSPGELEAEVEAIKKQLDSLVIQSRQYFAR